MELTGIERLMIEVIWMAELQIIDGIVNTRFHALVLANCMAIHWTILAAIIAQAKYFAQYTWYQV